MPFLLWAELVVTSFTWGFTSDHFERVPVTKVIRLSLKARVAKGLVTLNGNVTLNPP